MLYGNHTRYQALEEVLKKRAAGNPPEEKEDDFEIKQAPHPLSKAYPFIYRLFKRIRVIIHTGCIYVGNPDLETLLICHFKRMVLNSVCQPCVGDNKEVDLYSLLAGAEMKHVTCNIVRHPGHILNTTITSMYNAQKYTFVDNAVSAMSQILRHFKV